MNKFIKFKTVADKPNFVAIDSIFMVTTNEIYYTYGNKIESAIISENTYFDIVNRINSVSSDWIDVRDYVTDKNETSHLFVREKSIKGFIIKYEHYGLKLEHNYLPAEVAVIAMTEKDAEGLIEYLSE